MSLHRLLEQQQSRLEALTRLLDHEQEQLLNGTIDGARLEAIAEEKAGLLKRLEETEASRAKVQHRLGYPAGGPGARRAAEDADCLETWQATLDAAAHVARLNERNGRLIGLRASHNQQMLDYIHRIAEKSVYAPDGRATMGQRRLNTSA